MTAIHKFKCDKCSKEVFAKYNGEHWLPPKEWVGIYNEELAHCNGQHLCEKCKPPIKGIRRDSNS